MATDHEPISFIYTRGHQIRYLLVAGADSKEWVELKDGDAHTNQLTQDQSG